MLIQLRPGGLQTYVHSDRRVFRSHDEQTKRPVIYDLPDADAQKLLRERENTNSPTYFVVHVPTTRASRGPVRSPEKVQVSEPDAQPTATFLEGVGVVGDEESQAQPRTPARKVIRRGPAARKAGGEIDTGAASPVTITGAPPVIADDDTDPFEGADEGEGQEQGVEV